MDRVIEGTGEKDFGPCQCCGDMSRSVWGFVRQGDRTEAAYFVDWTLGHVNDHGAHFDVVFGPWGHDGSKADRQAVSLEFRRTERGPSFMVIDAESRAFARPGLAQRLLKRAEVIGTPLAQVVFDIVDAIWVQDARIGEITHGPTTG